MKRGAKRSRKSEHEELFAWQVKQAGIVQPVRQYPFAKCISRLYRADFCWPDERLIVEIQGGIFVNGRHSRGMGYEADLERNSLAAMLGWKVLQFSPRHVKSGWALSATEVALGLKEMSVDVARAKEYGR